MLAAGVLLIAGVIATKTSSRLGVPSLLLFIGLGMLAGSDGVGGIEFDDVDLARTFGIIALGFILFSGGLDTRFADIRPVLGQGIALASVGVVLTAGVIGGLASWALDLSLEEAVLLGAIVASTDAAAVFSILRSRGLAIDNRLGATLELESGSNDPAAVFLTVATIEVLTNEQSGLALIAGSFVLQMTLGAACGYGLARAATWLLNRLHLDFDGIYPVLTVGFVLLTLEAVTVVGGSGFLALYVAGVTMANRDYIHKRSLIRFHDGIAWLMQIAMFVLLGLLVFPARLPDVALDGLFVAAVLIFVARPLAVFLTLLPFRVPIRQTAFISWVGLRGATPIILATFPLAAGVSNASWLFDIVFFVVLTSVLVQGTTIGIAARRLRLVDDRAAPARSVSFDAVMTGDEGPRLHEVTIGPQSPAATRQILDLDLPMGVLVVLVRRGAVSFMPQGSTVLEVGDELLIAVEPQHAATIDEQFSA